MAWRLRRQGALTTAPSHLIVNPVACDGVGLCAHLAPEIVSLDRWGFPIVADAPLNGTARAAARRAVAGCPRSALFLTTASHSEDSEERSG
jgi:ferredoxin